MTSAWAGADHDHMAHTHTYTTPANIDLQHEGFGLMLLPYCPAVTPPPFATYFQEKEGGGA